MIKTRVQREHMVRVLNWYEEQLSQSFPGIILSEAQKEVMRQNFSQLQLRMRAAERTNCWQVPLQLVFNENGTYQVGIIDENSVLYLD